MKEIELTCEVYDSIEKVESILKEKKFRFIESFTLDDIYMYNKRNQEFFINDGKISDTLIIRNVDDVDKKIICKKREYNDDGLEIGTNKSVLRVKNVEESEKFLNSLGYERYLRMIDKNYMYENDKYIAYIQEIEELGTFLEVEAKNIRDEKNEMVNLIKYIKSWDIRTGKKFDIRKAEMFYQKKMEQSKL